MGGGQRGVEIRVLLLPQGAQVDLLDLDMAL